jgi:glycogen debranching enzyme
MTREDLTTISGHAFMVTDRLGDIAQDHDRGLFFADTRFLDRYALRLNGAVPRLLRSGPVGRNGADIYATNIALDGIPDYTLGVIRRRRLSGQLTEEIVVRNHGRDPARLEVTLAVDADFADIFEVRGVTPGEPPRRAAGRTVDRQIIYADRSRERKRQTRIRFSPAPTTVRPGLASFAVEVAPAQTWTLTVWVEWDVPQTETLLPVPIRSAVEEPSLVDWVRDAPVLETDDHHLLLAYNSSIRDLVTLELAVSSGHAIPAAGVPWYLAIFGRDSVITSLQTLSTAPRLAVGTLRTLAAYQANRKNAFRDAEPGKMPHEIRFGALSETGAVPHSRYYGTVDATPLWLILLGAAHDWIGDRTLVDELLPAAKQALRWIDDYGDLDGDGFIEYHKRSRQGLENQGWKDSWDGIQFADGRLAEPPIALVEVQGYVYAAKLAMARLSETLGLGDDATRLRGEAALLKERVHDAFWMPDEQCYAVALDGQKRQVDSIASNQGHLLWAGLPDQEHAQAVAERLMAPDSFSGWGIRTMATSMARYNPVGYHTGSVWPHDTALIAAGFRRYGCDREATALANGLIDASHWFDNHALPELFGGYDRAETPFPIDYPVACAPQAWAAGATIMLVAEMAGIAPGDDGLQVSPLPHGRDLRLSGVPFRGGHYDIDARADGGIRLAPVD